MGAVVLQCRIALTAGDVLGMLQRLLNGRDPKAGTASSRVTATWGQLQSTVLLLLSNLGIYSASTLVHGKSPQFSVCDETLGLLVKIT